MEKIVIEVDTPLHLDDDLIQMFFSMSRSNQVALKQPAYHDTNSSNQITILINFYQKTRSSSRYCTIKRRKSLTTYRARNIENTKKPIMRRTLLLVVINVNYKYTVQRYGNSNNICSYVCMIL